MVKKNMFRNINDEEMELISKAAGRFIKSNGGVIDKKVTRKFSSPQVCYISDYDQKFITCFLQPVKKSKKLFIGNSKRATYAKMFDKPNPRVGETIAFCRAIKNYINNANSIEI